MAGMKRAMGLLVRRIVTLQGTPAAPGCVLNGIAPLHTRCTGAAPPFLLNNERGGLAPAVKPLQASSNMRGVRHFSDTSGVPTLSDPQAKEALNILLTTNWSKIEKGVSDKVEAAIAKGGGDAGILSTVWSSAQASGKIADTLIALRMELDQLSGDSGEAVRRLPDILIRALESAYKKYTEYLEALGEDEEFLKKKLENDLGSILVQMKQRCNGLDPKWGNITLLGTSGLSGSYIELRHNP